MESPSTASCRSPPPPSEPPDPSLVVSLLPEPPVHPVPPEPPPALLPCVSHLAANPSCFSPPSVVVQIIMTVIPADSRTSAYVFSRPWMVAAFHWPEVIILSGGSVFTFTSFYLVQLSHLNRSKLTQPSPESSRNRLFVSPSPLRIKRLLVSFRGQKILHGFEFLVWDLEFTCSWWVLVVLVRLSSLSFELCLFARFARLQSQPFLVLIGFEHTDVHVQAPSPLRQMKIVSTSSQPRTKKIDFIPSVLEKMVLVMSTTIDIYLGLGTLPSPSNQSLVWVLSNRCEPPDPPVPPDPPPHPLASSIAHQTLQSREFLHLLLEYYPLTVLCSSLPLYEDLFTALCRLLPRTEDYLTALCRPLPRIEDYLTALCRPLPRIEDLDTLPLYEDFVTLPLYEDFGSFVEFFTPLYSPFVSNDCVARSVITGSFVRCLIASVAILEIGNCALVAVPISGVRSSTQDFTLLNNSIVEEIRGLLQDLYLFKCYVVIIPFSFSTYVIVISAYYAFVVMLSTNTYSFYGD